MRNNAPTSGSQGLRGSLTLPKIPPPPRTRMETPSQAIALCEAEWRDTTVHYYSVLITSQHGYLQQLELFDLYLIIIIIIITIKQGEDGNSNSNSSIRTDESGGMAVAEGIGCEAMRRGDAVWAVVVVTNNMQSAVATTTFGTCRCRHYYITAIDIITPPNSCSASHTRQRYHKTDAFGLVYFISMLNETIVM